jgi:PAS domain S-box-containing protein
MNNAAAAGREAGRRDTMRSDEWLPRTGDGVVAIADERIVGWNRAAETIMGFAAREVVGKACCEVFGGHDDHGNRVCYPGCGVQALTKIDDVQAFDMRARTKAGRAIWLNVSTLVLPPMPPRTAPMLLHLFRDITASKELVTLVHERTAGGPEEAVAGVLTRREVDVLRLVASGLDTKACAERLHVSTATIRNHVQNLFTKLGVHSRLEAVAYAHRHRLL